MVGGQTQSLPGKPPCKRGQSRSPHKYYSSTLFPSSLLIIPGNYLEKLVILLKDIIWVVKEYGGSCTIKFDKKCDVLAVFKREGNRMLPDELYDRFKKDGSSTVERC